MTNNQKLAKSADDTRTQLTEERCIIEAATDGPWEATDLRNAEDGNRDCIWVNQQSEATYSTVAEMDADEGLQIIWGLGDAEFIAHARTALPLRNAQVEAVLQVHHETMGGACSECEEISGREIEWPCTTVRAIEEASG